MEEVGSKQHIAKVRRDSPPSHFCPPRGGPCLLGNPDMETVTILDGEWAGRRAIITAGLNIPLSACRHSGFGLNLHQLAQIEPSGDFCEIVLGLMQ